MLQHVTPEISIGRTDRVLEIGSGNDPHPRANVLCDKYLHTPERCEDTLIVDRPLVIGDGERLPFKTKSFDYVICRHVVEHAEDVRQFLDELSRVGRAGYIETPSEIAENLFYFPYHRWSLVIRDGRLVLKRKSGTGIWCGNLFHHLFQHDRAFRYFFHSHPDLFRIRYYWLDTIEYEIAESGANTMPELEDWEFLKTFTIEPFRLERIVKQTLVLASPGPLIAALKRLRRAVTRSWVLMQLRGKQP